MLHFNSVFMNVQFISSVALVSDVQQSDSVTYILFQVFYRILGIVPVLYNSPSCLSLLYIVVYIC